MDTEKQNLKYVQVSLRELSRKQSELHYKKRLQESNDEEEKSRLRLMIAMSKIEIRPAILNYLDFTCGVLHDAALPLLRYCEFGK